MVEFPKYLDRWDVVLVLVLVLLYQNLSCCWSLNDEGFALLKFKERVLADPFGALANWNDDVGVVNPCSWNGIECSAGYVVSLNLKDLCLGGFIASDLGNLIHIKSIILRNNSFSGSIPENIAKLKELEVLDLGYNNLSGSLPPDLGSNLSLAILLLDHNGVFNCLSPEIYELQRLSEAQVDENLLYRGTKMPSCYGKVYTRNAAESRDVTQRKLLKLTERPINVTRPRNVTINVARPRNVTRPRQVQAPPFPPPSASPPAPPTSVSSSPDPPQNPHKSGGRIHVLVLVLAIGGSALLLCLVTGFIFCRSSKVAVVKPWATGLSGQLQKAFVTGVPKLNRSELVTACEDFSNVIGTPSSGTLYKGTLSSGVEIATLSFPVESAKDWTKTKKIQFREKIETLSKLNHKNFVNLLGYCEEEEPFTRMMVFEYAPNGTLFEHLHIKEAEHLDWTMRMRILMGMAYCLQHMHQLSPPITHMKLNSSAVYLTEDYAAKVSDFWFWNELAADELDLDPQSNVYSFGVLIFEMVTGQLPFTVAGEDWASEYLGGGQPLKNLVDPTLNSFHEQQLERIEEIMKACVNPDRKRRPEMREITGRLREATAIEPDAAIPKLSPLWWAELEILSTEANN